MLFYIWTVAILIALVLYFRQVYSRFDKYGVKYFKPVPLLGNMFRIMCRLENFVDAIEKLYKGFPGEKFVGSYDFVNPAILLRDIDLVKKITVKDFEHFLDHQSFVDEKTDELFGRNLLSLKGQEWKDMRATLSPTFTSSKIKLMVPFMVDASEQMLKSLKEKLQASGKDYIDIEAKDLTTRYANDVIASCAFGLKVDSHTEENNNFYRISKVASTFGFDVLLKFIGYTFFPAFMKKFNIQLFSEETKKFFREIVLTTMKNREQNNIIRPDLIHMLMEAKKGKLVYEVQDGIDAGAGFATVEESAIGQKKTNRVWSDNDLVAQAVLFIIAGFDTVSVAMTFTLYELALNPDVQEKLAKEIREHHERNKGKIAYNDILNLHYMDMVVTETLRLWPPAIAIDRTCVKDYNLGRPNSEATEDYIVRKGESVNIPMWSIHRDPEYYPDPLKFDPERFSDENKHNIKPFTYIPFGVGPRNCIGSRFALCEVKVMLYHLLLDMEVSPCEKTCIPVKLTIDSFNLTMKGGHWLRFKARN